jgi:hypothetical protein
MDTQIRSIEEVRNELLAALRANEYRTADDLIEELRQIRKEQADESRDYLRHGGRLGSHRGA